MPSGAGQCNQGPKECAASSLICCRRKLAADEPRQYRDRTKEPCNVRLIIRASIFAPILAAIFAPKRAARACTPYFPHGLSAALGLVLTLLLAPPAGAQDWTAAEAQLAAKIVSVAGPKNMAVEVLNRSSLSSATADDIRRNLLTQLAVLGAHFVPGEQGAATVRVSLSEDLQSYVWVAEIRQGANAASIVMVSLPRSAPLPVEPEAAAVVLRKIPLWSQPERILDVAVTGSNPARLLVLDGNGVKSYRLQDNRWQLEQSLPIVHSHPWPRDLRGRLVLANSKDLVFEAYLPGVHCRSLANAPPAMTCYDGDDPWPVGSDLSVLNASFTSTRNFFSGALSPAVGKQTTAPAFYSAAAVPRAQSTSWLFATVDGHSPSSRREHRSGHGKAGLGQ